MQTKYEIINIVLINLCSKVELQFRTKYFQLIPVIGNTLYYNNYKFNHPEYCCVELAHRQHNGNTPLKKSLLNVDLLNEVDADFKIYIDMRNKVEAALIDLSNNLDMYTFNKAMTMAEDLRDEMLTDKVNLHPFWALYKKQKLINRLWG